MPAVLKKPKHRYPVLIAGGALAILMIFRVLPVRAATFVVSNTNDSGSGSLRQAIIDANGTSGADVITFSIGSGHQQIIPTSALPPIIFPVIIDGTSQPGYSNAPLIELSGNGAGASAFGLRVTGNGAGSTIKGLIINHFTSDAIFLDSSNNTITSNYIGTNASGTATASNGGAGIGIFSGVGGAPASGNTIGGTTTQDRNLISGNNSNGIAITAQNGGTASNNIISGNYVGTDASGGGAIANTGDGILINNAVGTGVMANNTIGGTTGTTPGGTCTGACNLISGNTANGAGLWHGGVTGTVFSGNFVGANASGTSAIPNGNIGLEINETANNTAGGTTAAARNILSGNGGAGLFLTGAGATGNAISGNYIGTNSAGTVSVGNKRMGIGIGASPGDIGAHSSNIGGTTGTTPGGACTGACNLISGNREDGIYIEGSESYGHQILGNYIGTSASGTGSLGNVGDGIGILGAPNLLIGDGTSNGRNIIAAGGTRGIVVSGASATGNRIQGDYIGMSTDRSSMGNTDRGIVIASATDTAILGNSISYNGSLGIDLNNNRTVENNDGGDGDNGANHLQNFPNIYVAKNFGSSTKISGQFNSTANNSFRIELFSNDGCNAAPPQNYGEGQNYLGSVDISTDQFGNAGFTFTNSLLSGIKYITATATRKSGATPSETSEFSRCVLLNFSKPALTNGATWFLKYDLSTGPGDTAFGYGFPAYLLMCAWDSNQPGVRLPVVFSGGAWYMRASYTTGAADLHFGYGGSNTRPVCGDWDGDGVDTVGVVTPDSKWYLRNSNSSGNPDAANFQFGPFNSTPVVGDWDGDGSDSIGVVNGNSWSLKNTNSSGGADASFSYGYLPGYPIVGDWDGDGADTIGSVSPGGTWSLRNSNSAGPANGNFQFGFPGAVPVIW
jgi:hypothetical protein